MKNDAELARRNRELSILNTIAAALNREVDLPRALHVALAHVVELCGLQAGWVWLTDEAGGAELAATHHLPPALADSPERMRGGCYCLDSFRAGDMAGASNVSVITCTRLKGLDGGTEGLRHHASVPLYAHGRPLGVLNVSRADWRELDADDLRLLFTAGDLLSMAVERARLFARSAELGALEERNRLAREIHDTLAQGLAGIALRLEAADAALESGRADAARASVARALDLARLNLEEARRSVLDLRAAPLDGRGLAAALADLAADATRQGGPAVELALLGPGGEPPARVSLGLYRIAQEALANALRHAGASQVRLILERGAGRIALSVEDDGRGFDPAVAPPGRFGLLGMRERARLLGGRLEIDSAPRGGARLRVEAPL